MTRLEVSGIEVRSGGTTAIDGVDLSAAAGEVTGLVGPAGAGKTTLFNVITGLQRPSAGRVRLDGQDITTLAPHRRARLGMARIIQRLEAFGSLTVRENILVAPEIRRRWARDGSNSLKVTDEVMAEVGLRALSRERCDTLPTGLARLVEVARALATRPNLLLLDEPSAGLDERETEGLAALLVRLAAQDIAVLLVERNVDMAMAACQLVHVLDSGRVLAVGSPSEIERDPAVRACMGMEIGSGTETRRVLV